MYSVQIYDKTFNVLTTISQPHVFGLAYTNEINKPGNATFKILVNDARATATNLKLYNKVKIFKGTTCEFVGYIEELVVGLNIMQINCMGALALFQKRAFSTNYTSTTVSAAVYNILSTTNALSATGITQGVSDVVVGVNNLQFKRSTVLDAFYKLATIGGNAEIEIDSDGKLNIMQQLGSDKSNQIIFQYLSNQNNTANIFDFNVVVSGKNMANRVVGFTSSLVSDQNDATSIANFGLLMELINTTQTNNATDLANEVLNRLNSTKQEFYVPSIRPNPEKIDPDLYQIGDIVKVALKNGFVEVLQNQRILRKSISISDNNVISVDLQLVPEGSNLLPSSFFEDIVELKKKVSLLEGAI